MCQKNETLPVKDAIFQYKPVLFQSLIHPEVVWQMAGLILYYCNNRGRKGSEREKMVGGGGGEGLGEEKEKNSLKYYSV